MRTEQHSLLRYLMPESAPFHLELAWEGGESIGDRSSRFLALGANDPLSRVISGRVVTDMGTKVKDVLLLMQRDEYGLTDDLFCPITNPDMERAWQQAVSPFIKDGREDVLLLSGQTDSAGNPVPMGSLFFCTKTRIFFSPPCPTCGLSLQLCKDDHLLTLAGLRPYGRSLRRYLYCENCSGREKPVFYAYETDGMDHALAENRSGLIRRLASLTNSSEKNVDVICRGCTSREECYGPEQKALSSIVPFAFYPFYLLIVSQPSINLWNRQELEENEVIFAAREHALRLGWSIVTSLGNGLGEHPQATGIPKKLEMLRDGLGEEMLTPVQLAHTPPTDSPPVPEAIVRDTVKSGDVRRVLQDIGRDWRSRQAEQQSPAAEVLSDDDMEESVETVFLTLADLEESSSLQTAKTAVEKENQGLETVIQPPVRRMSADDMDKTVILSAAPIEKGDDLEKTVILNVGQSSEATSSPPHPVPAAPKISDTSFETDMDKTVIISADYQPAAPNERAAKPVARLDAVSAPEEVSKQPATKGEDDLMEATVILRVGDRPKIKGNK